MKGVILAGGSGSRMRPATHVTNKHLLPLYSQEGAVPMITYPIWTLIKSGITEILIISSREHCGHIIENLGDGHIFDADFTYKIQDTSHVHFGIASALKIARNYTREEKFAVILGDNYFEDTFKDDVLEFEDSDYECFLFLNETEEINRFGCATINERREILKIVEKPQHPESKWAVTGLYFYSPTVYSLAERLVPSQRQELEITDINDTYCRERRARGVFLTSYWSDMGTPESIMKTHSRIWEKSFDK